MTENKITKAAQKSAKKIKSDISKKRAEIKKQIADRRAAPNTVSTNRLKLLITIVNRSKAEYYLDLIQSFKVNMQVVALANGTADAKMLGLLGLSSNNEKTVIFSVIQENKVASALSALENKFKTIKDGNGVACTVAMSSVIGALIYGFLSDNRLMVKESK